MRALLALNAVVLLSFCTHVMLGAGGPCESDEECGDDICVTKLPEEDVFFPNGMCMGDCTYGGSSACEHGVERCIPAGSQAYCVLICTEDKECRVDEGYGCMALVPYDPTRYCLPEILRRPWDVPEDQGEPLRHRPLRPSSQAGSPPVLVSPGVLGLSEQLDRPPVTPISSLPVDAFDDPGLLI